MADILDNCEGNSSAHESSLTGNEGIYDLLKYSCMNIVC